MKQQDVYEINLLTMLAIWLMRWKQIVCAALIGAVAISASSIIWFEPPAADCLAYRDIRAALLGREITQARLESAQQSFEENLFHDMDPEKLMSKRLSLSVELSDYHLITDTVDPTDTVIYAYHNLAVSELQNQLLAPRLLTRLQQEQLLNISYSSSTNLLTVTMTGDDETLIDNVLALYAEWFPAQMSHIEKKTYPHTLTILPILHTTYDRTTAEEMISPRAELEDIQLLKTELDEYNTVLDEAFQMPDGRSAALTQQQLEQLFHEKTASESRPNVIFPLLAGFLIGAFVVMLYYSTQIILKGKLPGESGLAAAVDWPYIGRINTTPALKGTMAQFGYAMLYGRTQSSADDVCNMTALLLGDRHLSPTAHVALVGNVSPDAMKQAKTCFADLEVTVETANHKTRRVDAHRLCRSADAVIFIAAADEVTLDDIASLQDILIPLSKPPLGYMLTDK